MANKKTGWEKGLMPAGEGTACQTPSLGCRSGAVCWAGVFNSTLCLLCLGRADYLCALGFFHSSADVLSVQLVE